MAKVIKLETQQQKETRLVAGVFEDNQGIQYELYKYCADYYYNNYRSLFCVMEEAVEEIFQNSFITLWENIKCGKIYVEDNIVKGKNNKPLNCSVRTYLMGIAKFKYLEWHNEQSSTAVSDMVQKVSDNAFGLGDYMVTLYGNSENVQLEIIADIIAHMPKRCYEILTKYYYEGKDLDRILVEIPSIVSKNALKTKKYKCMENLREAANEIYEAYLKYN